MFKIAIIIILLAGLPSLSQAKEYVVILHGIFRTHKHMQSLADYLQKEGYEVLNLDYPSTKYPIEELVERTSKDID